MQIQSWLTSVMRGKFSLYETRIFAKIVESVQGKIKEEGGVTLCVGRQLSKDGVNAVFECRIKDLLNVGSHRYAEVKNALESLMHKEVYFQDEKKKIYKASYFINNFIWNSEEGKVTISTPDWLLQLILDFKKGASIYNLDIAMTFRRASTVRLYMLLCGQRNPITYPVSFLRSILGVGDNQYSQTRDFIKRIIDPARKEMDDRGCNGFTMQVNKANNARKAAITSVTFTPVKREQETKEMAASRVSLGMICPLPLRRYLTMQGIFTDEELGRIKTTLHEYGKLPDYQDSIVRIVERWRKKQATKGYIVKAMRSEVEQHTGKKILGKHEENANG